MSCREYDAFPARGSDRKLRGGAICWEGQMRKAISVRLRALPMDYVNEHDKSEVKGDTGHPHRFLRFSLAHKAAAYLDK